MTLFELLSIQLTDVFRIGLLAALFYTTLRNRANTGVAVPLLAGLVFVAVIIPVTTTVSQEPVWRVIASGLVANAIILAVMWIAMSLIFRKS
jgi:hypothetical protein